MVQVLKDNNKVLLEENDEELLFMVYLKIK